MLSTWLNLLVGFFKVGVLGYGGGPGSISLIQSISVDGYHWLDNDRFAELLAIGNSLPGPIATKLAGVIGWQTGGIVGAASALVGVVLPSLCLMLGLFQVLATYRHNPYVEGLIAGVKPIVLVLLVLLVVEFVPTTFSHRRIVLPALFFAVGLVLIRWVRVSPALVILGAMAGGALLLR